MGPYLNQQFLQKEITRATEHQSNLEYLLQQFNKSAPYPDQHLRLPERHHVNEDPEEAILPIPKSVYGAFGLDARFVLFYDEKSGLPIG